MTMCLSRAKHANICFGSSEQRKSMNFVWIRRNWDKYDKQNWDNMLAVFGIFAVWNRMLVARFDSHAVYRISYIGKFNTGIYMEPTFRWNFNTLWLILSVDTSLAFFLCQLFLVSPLHRKSINCWPYSFRWCAKWIWNNWSVVRLLGGASHSLTRFSK